MFENSITVQVCQSQLLQSWLGFVCLQKNILMSFFICLLCKYTEKCKDYLILLNRWRASEMFLKFLAFFNMADFYKF